MMEARFEHGQLFGILRVLFQITHTQITTEGNGAIVIPFLAGKDIKITFKDIVPAQVDGEPIPAYEYDISLIPEALSVLELKSATR